MNRRHNPTLSNLEEVEDEENSSFHSVSRHHLPNSASTTSASSHFRMQGTYSYLSPTGLATPNQPSTSTGSSSDIYTRFIQRYRDPNRPGEHDETHALQGLGSLLEGDFSDEEDMGLGMSRLSLKDTKNSLGTDMTIEPANDKERERLEWRAMLASVLDGDVLKSEKTRIAVALESISTRRQTRHDDIWFGLRANLSGTSDKECRKLIDEKRRRYTESIYADIMAFRVVTDEDTYADGPLPSAISQVELLLRRLDAVEDLYPTLKALHNDKPIYKEPAFQTRRDALIAWINLASALKHQLTSLKQWTGSDTLDITKPASTPDGASASSMQYSGEVDGSSTFVERVLKEESMHRMFEKKTLTTLHSFLKSTRESLVQHAETFRSLNLPMFQEELVQLVSFPSRLVEAILRVRLGYASKVKDPEPLMIDQMIDDFRIAIGLACTIRNEYERHVARDPMGKWILPLSISDSYDGIVLKAVKFLFRLMNWKFKVTPIEDIDITGIHGQLFDEISLKLTDGSRIVAEELCSLTVRLILRVKTSFEKSIREPKSSFRLANRAQRSIGSNTARSSISHNRGASINNTLNGLREVSSVRDERKAERLSAWYTSLLEEIRLPYKKLIRFSRLLSQRFASAAEYSLQGIPIDAFINKLVAMGHTLVYTKSFEEHGLYVVAHPSLRERPDFVREMMRKAFHVREFTHTHSQVQAHISEEDLDIHSEANSEVAYDSSYLLLLSPTEQFLWHGDVMLVEESKDGHHLEPNRVRLIADGPQFRLAWAKEAFNNFCSYPVEALPDTVFVGHLDCIYEQQSHISSVNKELRKVSKSLTRLIETIITSAQLVQQGLKGVAKCQELIAHWFSFASEHGQQAMKSIDTGSSYNISSMLTVLAISWVSFICDECDHSDRKTFRFAVNALEFAYFCTRRNNILRIPDDQFNLLQQKVATCMSLLISHFDILGARSSAQARQEKQRAMELRWWQVLEAKMRLDEDESLSRPPSPELGSSILGPMKATYERPSRLNRKEVVSQIEEVDNYRIAVEKEQHMIGRVLDVGIPEDRSLVDLVSSGTRMTMRWQQGRFVGAGAFGTVYQAINLTTGTIMAVKEIRYQELAGSNLFKQVMDELAIMELLHHPNIVEYYGIEAHRDKVYIFEEYCQGGSLAQLLELGRIEDEGIIQIYTMQMLEGLIYLHSKGIIHRDLKPDNILLDHMGVIKYVDFGAAKVLAKNQRTIQRTRIAANNTGTAAKMAPGIAMNNSLTGTPMYMAPEVIRNDVRGRSGAIDIWSLGCVVLECATGRRPWSNLDNEWAIMFQIGIATKHPPLPDPSQLSTEGIDFIRQCLTVDPLRRPSAQDLMDHFWMLDFKAALEEYEVEEAERGAPQSGVPSTETMTKVVRQAVVEQEELKQLISESPATSEIASSEGSSNPMSRQVSQMSETA